MKRPFAGISALLFLFSTAAAVETHVVYPTGTFPLDVENIQAVIDDLGARGVDGRIILKATDINGFPNEFNFDRFDNGDARGTVYIDGPDYGKDHRGSVAFIGEEVDGWRTTIGGGANVISFRRKDFLIVQGIDFIIPFRHAIYVAQSSGAVIRDNFFLFTLSPNDATHAAPIAFDGDVAASKTQITGTIRIIENRVESVAYDFFSAGVFLRSTNARILVSDNDVLFARNGIWNEMSWGVVRIQNNRIHAISPEPTWYTLGITSACQLGQDVGSIITDNQILVDAAPGNPFLSGGKGVYLLGQQRMVDDKLLDCPARNSVVAGNDITISGGLSGIDLLACSFGFTPGHNRVYSNLVYGNVIRGDAFVGIDVGELDIFFPEDTFDVHHNLFFGNRFEGFTSIGTDVFFDVQTRDNVYIGESETVNDLGTGNRIVLQP